MKTEAYLIQGIFAQDKFNLGLGISPITGVMATLKNSTSHEMFAGMMLFNDDLLGGVWVGEMVDRVGPSELHDIDISHNHLSFTKIYESARHNPIYYDFGMHDGIWKGQYQIQSSYALSGSVYGKASCLLTPAPPGLFEL